MAFALNLFILIQTYVLIALPADTKQSVAYGNAKGRAFMVSFLKNFGSDSQNSIIITTEKKTRVYVYVPSTAPLQAFVLQANSSIYVKLPLQTTVTSWGEPEHTAVSVYSSELVSVYGLTSSNRSSGGYLAIPLDKWSDHYTVATYDGLNKSGGEIIIIGAENNTSLTVVLKVAKPTRCGPDKKSVDRSTRLSISVNREDVIRIACDGDLTGSVIKGSKPIGVISGNTCTQVPIGVPYCDQLMEMMIPTASLGQDYIVAALGGNDTIFRVIYTDDSGDGRRRISAAGPTNLTIEHVGANATFNRANHLYKEYTISSSTVARLHASKPVLVVLFSLGTNSNLKYGDPSMTILVPTERYDSDYNVASSWKKPSEMSRFIFDVNVYSPGNVSNPSAPVVEVLSSASAFGFTVTHANITNSGLLTKGSFVPHSNIIFSASALGTTMAFPVGMKLEFFTGVDNCSNSPCLNDGICYAHGDKLACYCGDQLSGDRCENDIWNACSSFPCPNNSTCIDLAYMFQCVCPDNFTGDFCETEIPNACSSFPCENNSTCIDVGDRFQCVCRDNFTGNFCETDISLNTSLDSVDDETSKSRIEDMTNLSLTPASQYELYRKQDQSRITPAEMKAMTTPQPKTIVRETERCRCTCENVTAEEIQDQKEQIKKELSVDAKETNKNKIRLTSANDPRSSATGIGIVGILFLVLVFGCFMALDLMTVAAYIVMFIRNRRKPDKSEHYVDKSTNNTTLFHQVNYCDVFPSNIPQPSRNTATVGHKLPADDINSAGEKSELVKAPLPSLNSLYRNAKAFRKAASESVTNDIRNHIPASAETNLDLLYATPSSQPSTFTHSVISLPRFKVDSKQILVIGEDGQTFRIRKYSWSCRKLVENPTYDSDDAHEN